MAECPAFVRGSKLSVANVEGGVSVKVTTTDSAYLAPLRQMVREMARVIDEQSGQAATAPGATTPAAQLPPLDITVKNVSNGLLATVRAEKSEDVSLVRKQAQGLETLWATSECTKRDTAASR